MKLSVLMPVYNERQWVEKAVDRVLSQKVPGIKELEVIMVDDASNDGTDEVIKKIAEKHPKQIVTANHTVNQGKGAALRTAIGKISGDVVIIQDADLEYDPANYPLVLEPIIEGRADVVYGSRFMGSSAKRVLFFWHFLGNKVLTLLSNAFTNLNLTDMETGYKAFRADLLKSIPIDSNRFGFEPEVTAKIAKRRCRVYEVGISYAGRTYDQGKKITWVDGLKAIYTILRY